MEVTYRKYALKQENRVGTIVPKLVFFLMTGTMVLLFLFKSHFDTFLFFRLRKYMLTKI
jgi:hypothetical protein